MTRHDPSQPLSDQAPSFGTHRPKGSVLLTADDLAERWQVGKAHVYRLTRDGVVPAVRLGRYYRYRLEAVVEFEAGGGVADG